MRQRIRADNDPLGIAGWLTTLVPPAYAAYRPLLADGLSFFLEHLSPIRQQAILAAQLRLPASARPERRVLALLLLCPTLHKLGQVVAHDSRLSADLRRRLQQLESLLPGDSLDRIRPLLDRELGHVAGLEIAQEAIAEASVAVVVPFLWRQAGENGPQTGVLKVLRPGVRDRLDEELAIWPALGNHLEQRCLVHHLPALDYRHTLETVARLLANEVRLEREQVHLQQAAAFYADSPDILIPRLFPFSTASVTAMERVDGCKVTTAEQPPQQMQRRGERIVRALLAGPFWQGDEAGAVFHADPHAGNLLATADGRLAIIDWALTTRLSKRQCEAVVQLLLGALTLSDRRACMAIAALGRPIDPGGLQLAVGSAIGQVRAGRFPGIEWMTSLLDELATSSAVRFPEEMTLFRKALLTLSGVVADVSPRASIDRVLLREGAFRFFAGLAWRPWIWPDSRERVAAHLSNADLLGFCNELPLTALRFWLGIRG